MKHYYTAAEARQSLGLDIGAFYYLVETGKIKRITPPGKKRGFYSKHQIKSLANEKYSSSIGSKKAQAIFMKATMSDLDEEYELATLLLNGNAPYGVPTYQVWLSKNPDTNFILRDQGRLVAFLVVLPVQERTIKRWLKGEIREWEIGTEDVLLYSHINPSQCIIMSMATASDVDGHKRREYGLRILLGFFHFLQDSAAQGITISKFYSLGSTTEGSSILKRAGFEEKGKIGKRVLFECDPLNSSSLLAQKYRTSLQKVEPKAAK
jgi:hypothetical protein